MHIHRHIYALIVVIFTLLCSSPVYARSNNSRSADDTTTYFMEMVGQVNAANGAIQVTINPGRVIIEETQANPASVRKAFNDLKFASMADAMNHLSQLGWRLVDTYTLSVRNQTSVYWIVAKDTDEPSTLLDGLIK